MLRSRSFRNPVLVVALLLAASAVPLRADSNVRPQFAVGATIPSNWGTIDRGKSLSVGLEVERSPRVSYIAEFEVHDLSTTANGVRTVSLFAPTPFTSPSDWTDATSYAGMFGLRVHLVTAGAVRPYVQAGLGVRSTSGSGSIYAYPAAGSGTPGQKSQVDGANAHLRLGLTTAGYRGAGLFVDAGAEAMLRNPRDYMLAPIRLGITLP